MFKTVTVLRLSDSSTRASLSLTNLPIAIPGPTAADPDSTQWSRGGFSRLANFGESTIFVGADDTRVFNAQFRERILPGKVIRTKTAERVAEMESRQGHRCGRKLIAEIKDDVVATLLPTAFIRPVDVLCMITNDYLLIGTGSARVVDQVLTLLRKALPDDDLSFTSIPHGRQAGSWLLELLLTGTTNSGNFNVGESAVLKGANKSVVRFKDMELSGNSVQESAALGMSPVEIAVNYLDRASFSLSDQLVLKRIAFADILLKGVDDEADDAVSHFDATVALVAGELRTLLDDLLSEIPEAEGKTAPVEGL